MKAFDTRLKKLEAASASGWIPPLCLMEIDGVVYHKPEHGKPYKETIATEEEIKQARREGRLIMCVTFVDSDCEPTPQDVFDEEGVGQP
jgi:hypothetical protein